MKRISELCCVAIAFSEVEMLLCVCDSQEFMIELDDIENKFLFEQDGRKGQKKFFIWDKSLKEVCNNAKYE